MSLWDLPDIVSTGLDFMGFPLAPWRYLFSPRYRAATQARWRTTNPRRVALEQIGGIFAAVVSLALVGFLVALILSTRAAA